MPSKKSSIRTVPHSDGWANRRDGADRVSRVFDTQAQAEAAGRAAAKRDGVEYYLHGRDGRIRERDSYGNDPHPPKG